MSRIEVYFNLHKKVFSVRQGGRVLHHSPCVVIHNPRFVVQDGGRRRVLREGRKNVHAFVVAPTEADLVTLPPPDGTPTHGRAKILLAGWDTQVWYHPHHPDGLFQMSDALSESREEAQPIHEAEWAYMGVGHNRRPYILVKRKSI